MLLLLKLTLWAGGVLAGRQVLRAALVVPPPAPQTDPPPEPRAPEEVLRTVDRRLAWSAGAALVSAGGVVFPPVQVLAVPAALVPLLPLVWSSWQEGRAQGRLTLSGLDALTASATLLAGYPGACSVGLTAFFGGQRVALAGRRADPARALEGPGDARAWVLRDGTPVPVPLDQVQRGDRLVLHAGQGVPLDGVLVEGELLIDDRALSGESTPRERLPAEPLLAGALVQQGTGVLVVERSGSEQLAAQRAAWQSTLRSHEQRVQERAAQIGEASVVPTLAMGALGLGVAGPAGGLAGLWASCIDVLWVSAPLASRGLVDAAARGGLLVHDARSLELLGGLDVVVFDKTGTLTQEALEVVEVHAVGGTPEGEVLQLAAEAERWQDHPIARAILAAAATASPGSTPPGSAPEDLRVEPGLGLVRPSTGLCVGSRRLLQWRGVRIPRGLNARLGAAEARGDSVVLVAEQGRTLGGLVLRPRLRPEVPAALADLRTRGLELHLLSGDEPAPTEALAEQLGIPHARGRALPEDKAAYVRALQAEGRRVLYVGDGVNDTLAMREAAVSVSFRQASPAAEQTAQIVLLDADLRGLAGLLALGERAERTQERLLDAAVVPTVLTLGGVLTLGLGVVASTGIYLGAMGAALALAARERAWRPPSPTPALPDQKSSPGVVAV